MTNYRFKLIPCSVLEIVAGSSYSYRAAFQNSFIPLFHTVFGRVHDSVWIQYYYNELPAIYPFDPFPVEPEEKIILPQFIGPIVHTALSRPDVDLSSIECAPGEYWYSLSGDLSGLEDYQTDSKGFFGVLEKVN